MLVRPLFSHCVMSAFIIFLYDVMAGKMATKRQNPRNRGARYHLQVNFGSDEEMQAFKARLKRVRKLVSPGDGSEVDNVGLLGAMMDVVESKSSTHDQRSSTSTGVAAGVAMQSFLRNSGIYTGDSNPEDKQLFVAERHCLLDLFTGHAPVV